ncbi:MAG: TA system VapC family ribonuclease toxin [Candidatus Dormibacteria bacterium]
MNLCDVNVWLALTLSGHSHAAAARRWFDGVAAPASVLFCRTTQQAFLRLLTYPAVLARYGNPPLTTGEAWSVYEALLADDRVTFQADDPPGLEARWRELTLGAPSSPKLWMDAYLAAFSSAAGCRLVTTDIAFTRIPGLDVLLVA